MKKVPVYIIVTAVLLVAIVVAGLYGRHWLDGKIAGLREEQSRASLSIAALEKKTYSPTEQNLKLLKDSAAALNELTDNFKEELESRDRVFDAVRVTAEDKSQRGLDPDAWKKMFGNIRDRLTKEAADAKVKIPQDYDFSFSAYRLSLPAERLTLPLGIQLLGVEQLGNILIGAKVQGITAIRRVDPDGAAKDLSGGDLFGASILEGPGRLYKLYPFSLSFVCSPAAFNEVVNRINAAEPVFIIRDIVVENEKQTIPSASQVKSTVAGGGADKAPKLVYTVLGQEYIQVNMRVDLLYTTLHAAAEKAETNPNRSRQP